MMTMIMMIMVMMMMRNKRRNTQKRTSIGHEGRRGESRRGFEFWEIIRYLCSDTVGDYC